MKANKKQTESMRSHTQNVNGNEQGESDLITNKNVCDFPFCSCLSWCRKQRLS